MSAVILRDSPAFAYLQKRLVLFWATLSVYHISVNLTKGTIFLLSFKVFKGKSITFNLVVVCIT